MIFWTHTCIHKTYMHITNSHMERKEEKKGHRYLNRFSVVWNVSLPLRSSTVCWFVCLLVPISHQKSLLMS